MAQVVIDPRVAYQTLEHEEELALDIETSGLSPFSDTVAVLSLYGPKSETPCVLHIKGRMPEPMQALLRMPKRWITHNGTTFDLLFLKRMGFQPETHFDTMIAEQTMNTQARHDRSAKLSSTMRRRLGADTKMSIDHRSWMNDRLTVNQIKYCVEDIRLLHRLMVEQQETCERRGLGTALTNEQELTLATLDLQYNGLRVDSEALAEHNAAMVEAGEEAYDRLHDRFGHFNPNSPQQVLKVFKEYGLKNAQAATLEDLALREPLAMDVVIAKRGQRQYSVYGPSSKFAGFMDGDIIHTRAWQVGAETVRYTNTQPNMQQIPRSMRKVFRALPGFKAVKVDWSQLEVRVGAHIADDPALIDVCAASDVHSMMAMNAFRVPMDTWMQAQAHQLEQGLEKLPEPYATMRQQSKACTFIWLFDGGIPGIVDWAFINHIDGVTGGVASEMLLGMRQRFLKVNKFHQACRAMASQKGVVRVGLPWGHERQFYGSKLSTQIANTFIQGTAAVIMKQALLDLRRKGLLQYLGLTVHDEVVSTCVPEDIAWEYAQAVKQQMEESGMSICHRVPIVAEATVGDTWT